MFPNFLKKSQNGWDRMIIASLYLKPANKSIASTHRQKITGTRLFTEYPLSRLPTPSDRCHNQNFWNYFLMSTRQSPRALFIPTTPYYPAEESIRSPQAPPGKLKGFLLRKTMAILRNSFKRDEKRPRPPLRPTGKGLRRAPPPQGCIPAPAPPASAAGRSLGPWCAPGPSFWPGPPWRRSPLGC